MAIPDICFLFNSYSNSGKSIRREHVLRQEINRRWPNAKFILTQTNYSFWDKLKKELKGVPIIVACGGDGTVHKAGNLAIQIGACLGVVPIGSGNDFAHMLGIPKSIAASLNIITRKNLQYIDVIKLEGDIQCYCLNTTGVGLDGLANHYTNIYKKRIGKAGYQAGAIKAIFKNQSEDYIISIDGVNRTERCEMITFCNGQREGGSFWVAPQADPKDGLIDVLVLLPMTKITLLSALPVFLFSGSERFINRERFRCKKIDLQCARPNYIHVDGEYSNTKIQHVTLSIQKSALQVIA